MCKNRGWKSWDHFRFMPTKTLDIVIWEEQRRESAGASLKVSARVGDPKPWRMEGATTLTLQVPGHEDSKVVNSLCFTVFPRADPKNHNTVTDIELWAR